MNFINQLQKHKIVEVNKLTGLLTGHMVAQAPYRQVASETYLDNGAILFLNTAAELQLGTTGAELAQPFLHYTEELMNGPVNGYEFFTVDLDSELDGDPVCYPRAIGLQVGDEFTTNNINNLGTYVFGATNFAVLDTDGTLKLVDTAPATKLLFVAKKDKLPAGQPAAHLTVVRKA